MSQNTVKIKKRIKSVTGAYKVTSAMKLVSTVKLKKWKNKMLASESYNKELLEITSLLLKCSKNIKNIYTEPRNEGKRLYIIISSTLGLCGSYNINIFKASDVIVKPDDDLIVLGKKGLTHFTKNDYKPLEGFNFTNDILDKDLINALCKHIVTEYTKKTYKEIHIIYSHYKNSLIFTPTDFKLLPLVNENSDEDEINFPPLFEPNKETLIKTLIPIYLRGSIYSKLLESEVCEQASRSNAMENATDNAKEILDNLKIEFNKARQSAITQEIIEIVAASKAI